MQFWVVFDSSEVRPEVVFAAKGRRRAKLEPPIDSPTTVSYTSVSVTSIVYRSPFPCFRWVLALKIEAGSSFGR
jgi:hypothetical protein